jgi:hypothetical protein
LLRSILAKMGFSAAIAGRIDARDVAAAVVVVGLLGAVFVYTIIGGSDYLRSDWAQQQDKAAKEKVEQDRFLCHLQSVCRKYAEVRQDCATAGSFKTCVGVKMGDADGPLVDSCTNDGGVLYPASEMPGFLRCVWVKL